MGASAIYGENFSPLRDSIWSSPPNTFSNLRSNPLEKETNLSKTTPVGFENRQQRNVKTVSDIETELRKFQEPSARLSVGFSVVDICYRTQSIIGAF